MTPIGLALRLRVGQCKDRIPEGAFHQLNPEIDGRENPFIGLDQVPLVSVGNRESLGEVEPSLFIPGGKTFPPGCLKKLSDHPRARGTSGDRFLNEKQPDAFSEINRTDNVHRVSEDPVVQVPSLKILMGQAPRIAILPEDHPEAVESGV